eukprot:jgi/Botrbrau1/20512/Bobra.145_2s0065.1
MKSDHRQGVYRGRWEKRWLPAESAARSGHLQILQSLVHVDPSLLQYSYPSLFTAAAQGGSLDCLDFLERAGCKWDPSAASFAAGSGSSEALRYCLERSRDRLRCSHLHDAMHQAIKAGSPDCMQALYDYGYQCPAAGRGCHPAHLAIMYSSFACLQLAMILSGPPPLHSWSVSSAAAGGEEVLRLVHELGPTLDSETAERAAGAGQVGALRYALRHGAPLSAGTFAAAVNRGSVECLKCVFEHGLDVGFPAAYGETDGIPLWGTAPAGPFRPSLQVLRYVCEVMRPEWAQGVLATTAFVLAKSELEGEKEGWKMVLYMAKRMEGPLPPPLDELVLVRRERAAALAKAIYRAKRLARAAPPRPSMALLGAMD